MVETFNECLAIKFMRILLSKFIRISLFGIWYKFIKIVDMQIRWKKVLFEHPKLFEFLDPHHHRIHPITKEVEVLFDSAP